MNSSINQPIPETCAWREATHPEKCNENPPVLSSFPPPPISPGPYSRPSGRIANFDRLLVRYREPLAVQPHAPVAVIPERFQPELMDAVPLSLFSKSTKPSTSSI